MADIYGIEDEKLTENFMLSEFLRSRLADANQVQNRPSNEQLEVIRWVAKHVAQKIRDKIGFPLHVTSGFRNEEVNKLVGGVSDSYHTYKQAQFAFDCLAPALSLNELMEVIQSLNLPLNKVILELDQGVIHLQGVRPEFLVRDVIESKKIYVFYDQYKDSGSVV